jgi:hypothetical protein
MQLLDLPDELLDICCSRVDELTEPIDEDAYPTADQINLEALRNLRLTCKRISPLVNKHLFSKLVLRPSKSNALKARAILDDPRLNPLITTIYLQASLENDRSRRAERPNPTWNVQIDDESEGQTDDGGHLAEVGGEMSATFKRMMGDIGLFRNLRRIELVYHYVVEGPSASEPGAYREAYPTETVGYRDTFFRKLLSALNHPVHPANRLNSFSIHNLQDWVNADTATSRDFKALLSRLDELELLVVSEEEDNEYEIRIPERHEFYSRQLRRYWLQPLQEIGRLTHLKLYGSIPWGYLPKADLRGLHFPKLKSLVLGNMSFTHEWQLEWIVFHGRTLEELALHNCPIIPDIETVWSIDAEGYTILPTHYPGTGRGRRVASRAKYDSRWHDYFHNFRMNLTRLRRFAVTHGRWLQGNEGPSDALTDFLAPETWPAEIRVGRYCKMTGYSNQNHEHEVNC